MKQIIINADDLGADVCRNKGIAEAVDAGVVTSVSILVNGPAFDDALARLPAWQGRGVSIGLHVNFSEGYPVCKGLSALPDEHGRFRGKSSAHNLLIQEGNNELEREVSLELEAQIGLLEAQAIRISHLDGHQHVHVFPAVIAAAVRAARRHGITWLRISEEPAPSVFPLGEEESSGKPNHDPMEVLRREAARFSRQSAAARPFLNGSGIRTTDHFRGLYAKGRLTLACLEELLSMLPSGLTELMVHPGRSPAVPGQGPFAAFSTSDREGELAVLLNPRLLKILEEKRIFLAPYPETRL
ncbi:MAG: ChbG/HpnK family deacetylase [Syntrophales bacterium]